jgi:hypothetical protein
MAGISRGGILSITYAGMHPREVSGVINFVGGWMGEGAINSLTLAIHQLNRRLDA